MRKRPVTEPFEAVIVGAGFGGLCMAIRLLEEGIRDFVILEKGSEVGGTWRDNSYPGAACDVQSHFYSYSFEPKPTGASATRAGRRSSATSSTSSSGAGCGLFIPLRTSGELSGLRRRHRRWTVGTAGGERVQARHLVLASGPLHVPHVPEIPGLERVPRAGCSTRRAGTTATTSRASASPRSATGGSRPSSTARRSRRRAGRLHVFQRTPAWVIPRDTRRYSAAAQRRYARHPWLRRLHRGRLYWTNESRIVACCTRRSRSCPRCSRAAPAQLGSRTRRWSRRSRPTTPSRLQARC